MNVDEAMEIAASTAETVLADEVERLRAELAAAKAASVCPVMINACFYTAAFDYFGLSSEDSRRFDDWLRARMKERGSDMTMPHLMNCNHSGYGWCLECVKKLHNEVERLQEEVYFESVTNKDLIAFLADKKAENDKLKAELAAAKAELEEIQRKRVEKWISDSMKKRNQK